MISGLLFPRVNIDLMRTALNVRFIKLFSLLIAIMYVIGVASPVAAQMSSDPHIHYDDDGLIIHSHGGCSFDQQGMIDHTLSKSDCSLDGGDTAQREGWYWFGVWIRDHVRGMPRWQEKRKLDFGQVLDLLEPKHDGVFFRHPKIAPWNNPFDKESGTSRDQLVPLIAAMGVWGETTRLKRLWDALPQDLTGKHAFNGNWRDKNGDAGLNCTEIKNSDCNGSMTCSFPNNLKECELKRDERDCLAGEDKRICTLNHNGDECRIAGIKDANRLCVGKRDFENITYAAEKAKCEADKIIANKAYEPQKLQCVSLQIAANAGYLELKRACDVQRVSTAMSYSNAKALCEAAKSTHTRAACSIYKTAALEACRVTSIYTGDPFGPEYINLFLRSYGRDPMAPNLDLAFSPQIFKHGPDGEGELAANSQFRIDKSHADRDDTGPDLNHMIALIVSEMRMSTAVSRAAVHKYAHERSHSYGSYLAKDRAVNGVPILLAGPRIEEGIRHGWLPEVSAAFGAIKWYHRAITGANPGLATLYEPIIKYYIK